MLPDHLLMGLTPNHDLMLTVWLVSHPLPLLANYLGSLVRFPFPVIPPLPRL